MPVREGEVYRCALPECGCEVAVTIAAPPVRQDPLRCCEQTMEKVDTRPKQP
jgi:hypothetical protein